VGEFELLARLRARLSEGGARVRLGAGDDAAITVPGAATATSERSYRGSGAPATTPVRVEVRMRRGPFTRRNKLD
jgi:hypothetical protein